MLSLYPAHRRYTQWFSNTGLTKVNDGPLAMVFPASNAQAALTAVMPQYPALLNSGQSFRRGGHTLTGVFDLNGTPVFGKFVDFRRKKLWSRLRYNFMPSRGLWSAFMAHILESHNLPTPKVLGAGEVRENGLIAESYIFNEVLKTEDVIHYIHRTAKEAHSVETTAALLMQNLQRLHDIGITHGDLKLDNFYVTPEGRLGFWDLDATLFWPHGISALSRWRNVGCLIANLMNEFDRTEALLPSRGDFIRLCCRAYGRGNPELLQPMVTYWLRRYHLKRF